MKSAVAGIALVTMVHGAMADPLEERIMALAATSPIARYDWHGRGVAPLGYTKGMAVAWARTYGLWKKATPETKLMAMANTHLASTDALSWYAGIFEDNGMDNSRAGADTLRHLFVLLMGLGMRESSGKFCEGRDFSARNVSADTAEAGLFQMSWDAHIASIEIVNVFEAYREEYDDLLHIFHEDVHCAPGDLRNWGVGVGREFQEVCKGSPMCAILTAGVGLRTIRRHWGPINRREAEVRKEADRLFMQIQNMVDGIDMVAAGEPRG